MPLEIATFSVEDAILVSGIGVDRVEVCSNYELDGTTMPIDDLRTVGEHWKKNSIAIPMYAMIRPWDGSGSFVYSEDQFESMREEITDRISERLCDGFVFGILTSQQEVDEQHCRDLIALAGGLPCTFHRAIDSTPDKIKALRAVASCGFETVLSAGGARNAAEGLAVLKDMVDKADGVTVMAGGGIRSSTARLVKDETGVQWLHSAAKDADGNLSLGQIGAMLEGLV